MFAQKKQEQYPQKRMRVLLKQTKRPKKND